jgi:hypothetical protein
MRTLSAALLLVGAAFSVSAQAGSTHWDFTITVPVDVKALPQNIGEMTIACHVMPADVSNPQNEIASGFKNIMIHAPQSYFKGSVQLVFNAKAGFDPSLARFYRCTADFHGANNGVATTYFLIGGTSGSVFPLVAGAPFYLGGANWIPIPGAGQ